MIIKNRKLINLALQGGGSHGAFTWGVLDRLFEEEDRLQIEGISGASAGALNGALALQGYEEKGALGAKAKLDQFWGRIAGIGVFGSGQRTILDQMFGNWNTDFSPGSMMLDMMGRMFSPYQVNPMNINPLRDLLVEVIDVPLIRRSVAFKLFVGATNVESGKVRVFTRDELSVDTLMASACFPFSFQAVEIDGFHYWDGGYTGNPPLFPFSTHCRSADVVLVQLIPIQRERTPDTLTDIVNRLDEVTFNTAMMGEMRTIALVQELVEKNMLTAEGLERVRKLNIHIIRDAEGIDAVGITSRMNTEMSFLLHLKEMGRRAAEQWLVAHWESIGEKSTVDIQKMFLS